MATKSARNRAEDPTTPSTELAELAAAHPELCGIIYVHPNVYDDLKQWISTHYPEHVPVAAEEPITAAPSTAVSPAVSAPPFAATAQSAAGAQPELAAPVATSWWSRPKAALYTSIGIGAAAVLIMLLIIFPTALRVADLNSRAAYAESAPIGEPEASSDTPAEGPAETPNDTPTQAPQTPTSRIPASCTDLYSAAMINSIQASGFRLGTTARLNNPAGTDDGPLSEMIRNSPRLECTWHRSNADTAGIETSVVEVDQASVSAIGTRLQALGYAPLNELGGVRYVIENVRSDGTHYGESHMLRDGIWFATRWVQYGPDGYSADMVAQVFG